MERLTIRTPNGAALIMGDNYENEAAARADLMRRFLVAVDRLAGYEDTGLEPEEVKDMADNAETRCLTWFESRYGFPAGELMRILEAKQDGRLVVLPCKVGDAAYWVHNGVITDCRVNRIQLNRAGLFICLRSKVSHGAFSVRCIGKSVFFSHREAEAALEGDNYGKENS